MKYYISHRQLVSGMFAEEIYNMLDQSLCKKICNQISFYYDDNPNLYDKTTDALQQVERYEISPN